MTDRDAFLRAIAAAPDDDGPRLVYADWLDENGEAERAELIRVQCAVSRRLDGDGHVKDCCIGGCAPGRDIAKHPCVACRFAWPLRRRVADLLNAHAALWGADLPVPAHPRHDHCEWRRGFVEKLTCTAGVWLAHGDAILAEHPVQVVWLTTYPEMNALRLRGMREWRVPVVAGMDAKEHFAAEWPSVREWHLPTARDQNREFLDRILGVPAGDLDIDLATPEGQAAIADVLASDFVSRHF